MPIYEYECTIHGREEVLYITTDAPKTFRCNNVINRWKMVWSLVSMQPDNMWSGKITDLGYFTSKQKFEQHIKNNNLERIDRGGYEQVQKKSKNKLSEIKRKQKRKLQNI